MIELREVTKEYSKGVAALNGINLKIEQGEFVFIWETADLVSLR